MQQHHIPKPQVKKSFHQPAMKTNQGARNPKKRTPGRSTTQNKNTKPDRLVDRPTDL